MLRDQGLGDSELAQLRAQGFLERSVDGNTVRYEVLVNGSVSITSSSMQAITGASFDAAHISDALKAMPPGMAGMLADPIAQAETMLGQDLDGDGVIGSTGGIASNSRQFAPVQPVQPMQPHDISPGTDYGIPSMQQSSSSGLPWPLIALFIAACVAVGWYLLSR